VESPQGTSVLYLQTFNLTTEIFVLEADADVLIIHLASFTKSSLLFCSQGAAWWKLRLHLCHRLHHAVPEHVDQIRIQVFPGEGYSIPPEKTMDPRLSSFGGRPPRMSLLKES
jgi:hypothetical protein